MLLQKLLWVFTSGNLTRGTSRVTLFQSTIMRNQICLSVLVLLVACTCADYQENKESERDVSAEFQQLEVEKRNFTEWWERNSGWALPVLNAVAALGKKRDVSAELQKSAVQKRNLWEWFKEHSDVVVAVANVLAGLGKRDAEFQKSYSEVQRRGVASDVVFKAHGSVLEKREDLSAENQKRDLEVQRRGFFKSFLGAAAAHLFFGKREDLSAENQKRDLEVQRRGFFKSFLGAAAAHLFFGKREDLSAENQKRDLEVQRRGFFKSFLGAAAAHLFFGKREDLSAENQKRDLEVQRRGFFKSFLGAAAAHLFFGKREDAEFQKSYSEVQRRDPVASDVVFKAHSSVLEKREGVSVENQKRDLEVQRRGFWSFAKKLANAGLAGKLLVKRQDAEFEKSHSEVQRRDPVASDVVFKAHSSVLEKREDQKRDLQLQKPALSN